MRAVVVKVAAATAAASLFLMRGAAAQDAPKGVLFGIAQRLATQGSAAGKAGKPGPATRFKPSGSPIILDDLVAKLGQSDEQRSALRQLLTKGEEAAGEALRKEGRANDVSAAYALFVATQWGAATGKAVPDAASDALLAQTDSLLNTPKIGALSDADKQRFYEYCMYMSVFTSFMQDAAADATAKQNIRTIATHMFQTLVPIAPEKVTISVGRGLVMSGASAPSTAGTASSGLLSVNALPEWQKEADGNGVMYTRSIGTENGGLKVTALVLTRAARAGTPEALINDLFDQFVRKNIPAPGLPADIRPEAFRRYVGNDLRCSFASVSRKIKKDSMDYLGTSQEFHIYAVETGGKVVPILVTLTGHEGSGAGGKLVKASVRNDWIEELLSSLSGTPGSKPLYSNAELAGFYKMSSGTTGLQYYNIYTGASAGYAFVTRGGKLTLSADGTFDVMNYGSTGIAVSPGFQIEKGKGRYQLVKKGNSVQLVMTDAATGKGFTQRLAGAFTLPGNAGKMLITLPMNEVVTTSTVALSADHYHTAPPE